MKILIFMFCFILLIFFGIRKAVGAGIVLHTINPLTITFIIFPLLHVWLWTCSSSKVKGSSRSHKYPPPPVPEKSYRYLFYLNKCERNIKAPSSYSRNKRCRCFIFLKLYFNLFKPNILLIFIMCGAYCSSNLTTFKYCRRIVPIGTRYSNDNWNTKTMLKVIKHR
jgi:hypothetical protein